MHSYEIEIKSLLGKKENADALREKLLSKGLSLKSEHSQLNHYFNAPEDRKDFADAILPELPENRREVFEKVVLEGKGISVRTRDADGKVLLVVKASIGDDSSENGVKRIEFEEEMNMTLDELDSMLVKVGLTYQAKWSRQREEYAGDDLNVTIDKNAGYGYLAEFEKVTDDESKVDELRGGLLSIMGEFGVEELPQDRLERMFDFYNKNWEEYYGTDKVFVIL
ncbi:MAG: hypothetical protein COV70_00580 [Parcubacteria group bacterium CG11_big_fil_rev_8_21_14_0_20_39_22]|nr:MAG: hypothetical protein COV70_00580 [Parcubacteria group bacterium CG11_big_fil_rev_8_21_14_0_20_39_22]